MYAFLRCIACSRELPAGHHLRCPGCGGELDACYDLPRLRDDRAFHRSWTTRAPFAESFAPLLPLRYPERAVSLGEGHTPLIRAPRLAARLGLRTLFLKLESSNPTGSFKDRQVAIGISEALEAGHRRFATVSSGNVGVALAAYAARAGAEADVWVSHETPEAKLRQIRVYGARLFLLPSPATGGPDAYFGAIRDLGAFCRGHGLVPAASARPVNPFMVEGGKTVAFEIARDLGRAPDLLAVPTGGGGLVGGVHKGFRELAALDLVAGPPPLLAAQRQAYFAPIDDVDNPRFRTGYYIPMDGNWAWDSIRQSGGTLRQVGDPAIRAAQVLLAETEGVFAEPHGAYAVAGLVAAARDGALDPEALVVCIITGHGLKDMEAADEMIGLSRAPAPVEVASLQATPVPA